MKKSKKLVCLRLSLTADRLLRAYVKRKGDVAKLVNKAIVNTDLGAINVSPRNKLPGSGREKFMYTSAIFLAEVYKEIATAAKKKDVSATALIDAVIVNFYSKIRGIEVSNVESKNCYSH